MTPELTEMAKSSPEEAGTPRLDGKMAKDLRLLKRLKMKGRSSVPEAET